MAADVIILASGPSVREYNLRDLEMRGALIAINGAALYTKPAVALTMDRLVAEYCVPLWRIQGVPAIWIRKGIAKNFSPIGCMEFEHEGNTPTFMTPRMDKLNGSNSSTCALNLALQLSPRRVYLLGLDMQRGDDNLPYWHPPYPWNTTGAAKNRKLAEWAQEFADIKKQFDIHRIEIINVNHRSKITAFPVIAYDEFRRRTDAS